MATGDLFDLYFTYNKDISEAPIIFHRWSLVGALGAYLGRNCWIPFGASRIFPNQYIMLVGHPGSRKSNAIKAAKRILGATGYDTFAAEKTTKEKFLLDLQGDTDVNSKETIVNLFGSGAHDAVPREVFIVADEFNEFTGSGNLEFLSMLGALWDFDDETTPYKSRTKTSKSIEVYQPTVSILGGNTYSGFAEAFPLSILGQGFMSRLVLIHSEPSGRKITIPPIPNATLLALIVDELRSIKNECYGAIGFSKQAYSALDSIYKTWPELEDNRFKHYSTRRFTHLLKLCLAVCAIGKRREILVEDVLLANTILAFAEQGMPKAMGELGKKRSSDVSSTIMNILYEARKPVEAMELWRHVEKDLEHLSDLTRLLANLQAADKILTTKANGIQGFLAKQKPISTKQMYVDLNLLHGLEIK